MSCLWADNVTSVIRWSSDKVQISYLVVLILYKQSYYYKCTWRSMEVESLPSPLVALGIRMLSIWDNLSSKKNYMLHFKCWNLSLVKEFTSFTSCRNLCKLVYSYQKFYFEVSNVSYFLDIFILIVLLGVLRRCGLIISWWWLDTISRMCTLFVS